MTLSGGFAATSPKGEAFGGGEPKGEVFGGTKGEKKMKKVIGFMRALEGWGIKKACIENGFYTAGC